MGTGKIRKSKINWQDFHQVRQLLLKKAYREKQLRARALEKAQAVADWLKMVLPVLNGAWNWK